MTPRHERSNRRWLTPLIGSLLLPLAACDDALQENPLGTLTPVNFYQNADDALIAVNAAYGILHEDGAPVDRDYVFVVETPSPAVTPMDDQFDVQGCSEVFTCTVDHGYTESIWVAHYNGINRANAVIDNVPGIEMNAGLKARVVGEAKFLRALQYFNLARLFGGVPLFQQETRRLRDVDRPRAPADSIYELIIEDLTEAAEALPVSYPASEFGRATRGAAQTLLGKVYLHRGVAGRSNPFGDPLYWPSAEPDDLQKAEAALRAVVNSGEYSLVPDYGMMWKEETEMNSEVIFVVRNENLPGLGMAGASNYLNPRESGWINSWNSANAELPFFQSYAEGDTRRDITFLTEYTDRDGETRVWTEELAGSWWSAPSLRKYLPERGDIVDNPRDLVLLRYADVLLMLAEVLWRQDPASGEALQIVNQVRARAGVAPVGRLTEEALYWERNWELASEQKQWYDSARFWDLYKAHVIANARLGIEQPEAYPYRTVPQIIPGVEEEPRVRLLPIPQAERDRNPNLTQNPGY